MGERENFMRMFDGSDGMGLPSLPSLLSEFQGVADNIRRPAVILLDGIGVDIHSEACA